MSRSEEHHLSVTRRLSTLRRRYAFWATEALFMQWALVAGALVLAGVLWIDQAGNTARIFLSFLGLAGLFATVYASRKSLIEMLGLRRFARYLQRKAPSLRQDYEIALAFEESLPDEPVQRSLALRHCERALESVEKTPPEVVTASRNLRIELVALGVWLMVPLAAFWNDVGVRDLRQAWLQWDGAAGAEAGEADAGERFLAEFGFTIAPPEYTGLPPEKVTGNGEWLRAYRGSNVNLELRVQGSPERARLQLADESIVELEPAGRALEGDFIVSDEGGFRLLIRRDGEWIEDATPRRVELIPDQYPTVQLLEPEDELVVRPGDSVTVRYEARDDFAVSKAELVLDGGDGERRFPMPFSEVEHYRAQKRFAVREWGQREGATIRYHVEVWDNDAVSGP